MNSPIFFIVPPQILPFDFGGVPINTDDVTMTNCFVTKGDFPIEIKWTLNGIDIRDIIGVSIFNTNKRNSQLSIDSVQAFHAGEYVCIAKNSAGLARFSTILDINGICVLFYL